MGKKAGPKAAEKPTYIPTAAEQELMSEWLKRDAPKVPRVTVTVGPTGIYDLGVSHPEPVLGELQLLKALGLSSAGELGMFKRQMFGMTKASDGADPKNVEREMNNLIDVIVAHRPKGITEAMLCLQMAAVHMAIARSMQTVVNTDYADQRAAASDAVNKLSRTFTMQVDALKRHRSKGREQRVVVEHKHYNYVAPGAQAVFVEGEPKGDGGGVSKETAPQSHERAAPVAKLTQSGERPMKLVDLAVPEKAVA